LRLQPESADARINLGTFLQQQMRHEEAVALFSEALQRKPTSIDAQWNKSLSLLALGHYAEGWSLHEAGLGIAPMRGEFPLPERRWQGEDITGKRLLIRAEQGFGDTLQFVRYAALCKTRGATIIVQCPPALLRLIANCPFVDRMCEQAHEQDFDFHVAMMTLPHIFATTLDTIPATIPYLHIGAATRAKWANKFTQPGFKVGLVWAGNPREKQIDAQRADARRSMDLELLRPLFAIDGAHFYNLQMGAKAAQIDACGLRGRMEDYMGEAQDFEDTGAIIERLDLVITVDTSVAHLAGGLGKPVWILSRFDACWRWLQNRPDSPWYPTARIFGQQTPEDWPGVVERVKEALAQEIVRKR
jgi:tetratricopeptide (TPR) repeat protein